MKRRKLVLQINLEENGKARRVDETGHTVEIKPIKKTGRSVRVNISKLKTYFGRLVQEENKEQEVIKIEDSQANARQKKKRVDNQTNASVTLRRSPRNKNRLNYAE